MSAGNGSYTRLPGRAWGLFGAATLWLGADHVLQVRLRGYTEVYRRFYFRDLQLLALRPTRGYLGWALGLGLPALLFGGMALANLAPAWQLWAVFAAIFALPLAVHLARGATCRCYATTPLGTTELAALKRLRPARRSLARIRAGVEAVQGQFDAQVPLDTATIAPDNSPARIPAPAPPLADLPPPLPSRRPTQWHGVLVALLAADTVLSAAQASTDLRLLDLLGILFAVAEVAVALAAIVAQGRSNLRRGALRRFPWAALAFIGSLNLIGWVAGIIWAFRQASSGALTPASMVMQLPHSLELAAVLCYLALALWGWLALRLKGGREGVE